MTKSASPDSVRPSDRTTRWWWVRHAPVVVNNGCCYGQTDHPCNTDDPPAYRRLAQILPREAVWVTSNLRRTHETAAAIVAAGLPGPATFPGPDVTVETDLAEQHFGEWQGRTYASLAAERAEEYHRFWLAPATERPAGGESFVDLMTRVTSTIHRLNERFAGRDIIAVTHGGTIRAALALALDLPPEAALAFAIDNISVTRLDHFPEGAGGLGHGWRVNSVNQPPR
ncbi:phosphoglycerate kinase [Aliidongia dinghuensis]|uniref:Phosphoglycerate kinase n=1 Tax=Aliidongia dinghuensis TaxID=1867774 RepID=A0A8J2YQJ2_9PROT|nr:histidine phosphatase family protein [Aliidongia dinghuensis]GGF02489.1 phosphoglycerate kinase [Aliidongia dinghuensis]